VNRILVLGRGAAGKSTLATRLSTHTGIPLVELDSVFWRPDLTPTPPTEWIALQQKLTAEPRWILDGDLGPYDVLEARLSAADTVVLLDFSLFRCLWRALRRSRERLDFWLWLVFWRRRSRPAILAAIARHAPTATLQILRNPLAVERWLSQP
jgi:adenylate kinase family enzyme